MKKTYLLVAAGLILILAGGVYFFHGEKVSLLGKVAELARKEGLAKLDAASTGSDNPLEEAAGLAIKGINLFQGDDGVELWRLKATWAHLTREGGDINVDRPVVRYALGDASAANPDDDVLDVKALKGQITDNQRHLSLWDDVVITRYDDTITAPRMNYDTATRTMTFPEGATLESPTASGTAGVFTWDLAKNEMVGTQGVNVLLKAREDEKTPEASPSSAAVSSDSSDTDMPDSPEAASSASPAR